MSSFTFKYGIIVVGISSKDLNYTEMQHMRKVKILKLIKKIIHTLGQQQKLAVILFCLYLLILAKLIILKLPLHMTIEILEDWHFEKVLTHLLDSNMTPFHTINNYLIAYRNQSVSDTILFYNLVGNVIAFIPFGILYPLCLGSQHKFFRVMKGSFLYIGMIELTQLVTVLGSFDVDDFILNLLGTLMGYIIYKGLKVEPIETINHQDAIKSIADNKKISTFELF